MVEIHPFEPFVPANATILIVGSFPGKEQTQNEPGENEWFYGAKRNQFWNILRSVYSVDLLTKKEKQDLFNTAGIAITDIFLKIERTRNNNLDDNLKIIENNSIAIKKILSEKQLSAIFFTSKFVEKSFMRLFPDVKVGKYLPSPSPRYARMSKTEKIEHYRIMLPKL